jgi:hypothetical protein
MNNRQCFSILIGFNSILKEYIRFSLIDNINIVRLNISSTLEFYWICLNHWLFNAMSCKFLIFNYFNFIYRVLSTLNKAPGYLTKNKKTKLQVTKVVKLMSYKTIDNVSIVEHKNKTLCLKYSHCVFFFFNLASE